MLKIDPAGNVILGVSEEEAAALKAAAGAVAQKFSRPKFRLIRQSQKNPPLTARSKKQVLDLYKAMLRNPQISDHAQNMNSVEDMEFFLSLCAGKENHPDEEHWLVIAEYQGRIISFVYGELHKPSRVFGLWYLVGPGNVRYTDIYAKEQLPAHVDPENVQYTQTLVLTLLEELRRSKAADCLLFEVDADNLKDTRGVEISRLILYSQMEKALVKRMQNPLTRPLGSGPIAVEKTYVLDFPYIMPQNCGTTVTKVPGVLSCIPLSEPLRRAFRTGQVASREVYKMLRGIYRMYYDPYPENDPTGQAVRKMALEILRDFDTRTAGQTIPCVSLTDYRALIARRHA